MECIQASVSDLNGGGSELRQQLPKSNGPRLDRPLVRYCSTGLSSSGDLKNYLLARMRNDHKALWIFPGVSLQVSNMLWAHRAAVQVWEGRGEVLGFPNCRNVESVFNISDSAEVQTARQCLRWSLPELFFRENKKVFAVQSKPFLPGPSPHGRGC